MKRLWVLISTLLALLAVGLLAGWWWAIALEVVDIVGSLMATALLRWRELEGWRYWYGLGGAITYVVVLFRVLPPMFVWLWRDARPTPTEIVVGIVVFAAIPILGTVVVTVAWPLVVYWLIADVARSIRSRRNDGHS